jgi:dihydrofolate synthase/folylpolyglutamate synthase
MGGRLDSTNVCHPLISAITSISFDHTKQLGNTLAAIAREKAGIIKPGVPVISGVMEDEPRRVIEKVAKEANCRLVQLGTEFDFDYRPPRELDRSAARGAMDVRFRGDVTDVNWENVEIGLPGRHQAANAAVALAVLAELRKQGWHLPETAIRRGLSEERLPARIEVVFRRPTVIIDAAHNVASVQSLLTTLEESFNATKRLLIFGTTHDKDAQGMLELLLPEFDAVILTRYHSNPRAINVDELDSLAGSILPIERLVCADAAEAWSAARAMAKVDDLICVTGSFFLAAEMRAAIARHRAPSAAQLC